jgi:uncharacterized protein (DUF2252 family)
VGKQSFCEFCFSEKKGQKEFERRRKERKGKRKRREWKRVVLREKSRKELVKQEGSGKARKVGRRLEKS